MEDPKMVEKSSSFRPSFVPKTDFLDKRSAIADAPEKVAKLDDFVKRFEAEMKKLDAFKGELPLSTLFLNDVMSALKKSLRFEPAKAPAVLGEFIPAKTDSDGIDDVDSDKKNSTKSVKLSYDDDTKAENTRIENETESKESERKRSMPFEARSSVPDGEGDEEKLPTQTLPLFTVDINGRTEQSPSSFASINFENDELSLSRPDLQRSKKPRRRWSPELEERIVDSFQKFGGETVAIPKQIQDLVQVVVGETMDEIKSYLQRHRLQTRTLSRCQVGANVRTAIGAGESSEDDEKTQSEDSF